MIFVDTKNGRTKDKKFFSPLCGAVGFVIRDKHAGSATLLVIWNVAHGATNLVRRKVSDSFWRHASAVNSNSVIYVRHIRAQ
jgi:hypothetical protein